MPGGVQAPPLDSRLSQTMHRNADQGSERPIILSGGRARELAGVSGRARHRPETIPACPGCGSDLIQLMSWMQVADRRWKVTLQCPNCWWLGEAVYGPDQVAELERKMEDGVAKLLWDLRRLANAIAAEELERFVTALHADLILPEDF
jgi:hypothetical protein